MCCSSSFRIATTASFSAGCPSPPRRPPKPCLRSGDCAKCLLSAQAAHGAFQLPLSQRQSPRRRQGLAWLWRHRLLAKEKLNLGVLRGKIKAQRKKVLYLHVSAAAPGAAQSPCPSPPEPLSVRGTVGSGQSEKCKARYGAPECSTS